MHLLLGSATAITPEMLEPVTTAVTENLSTLLPVGIGVMGIMMGVSLIPRIIWKFF